MARCVVVLVKLALLLLFFEVEPAGVNGANLVDVLLQRERRSHASAPFMLKQEFRNRPAAIFGADQIGGRHAQVGEEYFVEMMEAVDRADRADFDPWRRHVDKEEADSGLPPSLAARPDKREHPVGPVCIRRPDLLSVDDIVRAIPNGSCTKSREIRPGAGLRKDRKSTSMNSSHT